jgi:hypothetical protein
MFLVQRKQSSNAGFGIQTVGASRSLTPEEEMVRGGYGNVFKCTCAYLMKMVLLGCNGKRGMKPLVPAANLSRCTHVLMNK